MKRFIYCLTTLAALAFMASCQPEQPEVPYGFNTVKASFKVELGDLTKAFADGTQANTLQAGLYEKAQAGYTLIDKVTNGSVSSKAGTITFNGKLEKGKEYVVAFWAQNSACTAYALDWGATGPVLTVTPTGAANDDARDAFCGLYETGVVTGNITAAAVTLKRPFSQVNVLVPKANIAEGATLLSSMTVKQAPTTMNLITKETGTPADYVFAEAAMAEPSFGDYATTHVYTAMNYVLVSQTSADPRYDVTLAVKANAEDSGDKTVASAPLRPNVRTNIVGNVFSNTFGVSVPVTIESDPAGSSDLRAIAVLVGDTSGEEAPAAGVPVAVGATQNLTPTYPGATSAVTAFSSDLSVATVAVDGQTVKVTGIANGTAIITIVVASGTKSDTYNESSTSVEVVIGSGVKTPEFTESTTDELAWGSKVHVATTTVGATIYYTTAVPPAVPADPTAESAAYPEDGITVTEDVTIKAIAIKGDKASEIATATYDVAAPLLTGITLDTSNAQTVFTVGGAFSHDGVVVTGIYQGDTQAPVTDQATFSTPNMTSAGTKTVTVTVGNFQKTYEITVQAQVATPAFSPAAGAVDANTPVTITCATTGADIYYTLDGNAPTTSSTKYTDPIVIDQGKTIKAIAVKTGMANSEVATAEYTVKGVVATPTFTPAAGYVDSGTSVAISCSTEGATIHYTTDGSTPTASSPSYTAAIVISAAKTIKAIAVKDGMTNSVVATAAYSLTTPLVMSAITCTAQTSNSLTFSWTAVTNASGYQVSIDSGNTYGATQNGTTYTWTGLPAFTEKTVYVKAIGSGAYTDSAPASASGTTSKVPLVMSTITCTAQTETSLTFSWTAVTNASGYQVSIDGGNTYGATQNVTTYTWTGLSASTEKTIYVKAIGSGIYADSAPGTASGTTSAAPTQLVMSDITCTAQTENSLTFSWTDVPNSTGYIISTDGGNIYDDAQTGTTYTWTGLSASTEKTIYVKAVGDNGSYITSEPKSASGTTSAHAVTIAELKDLMDANSGAITENVTLGTVKVTYVKSSNAYIEDATGGMVIYKSGHGLTASKSYSGIVVSATTMYQTYAYEITNLDTSSATSESLNELPVTELTLATLDSQFAKYQYMRVRVVGATLSAAATASNKNVEVTQNMTPFTTRFDYLTGQNTVKAESVVTMVGYPNAYSDAKQFTVMTAGDVDVTTEGIETAVIQINNINLVPGGVMDLSTLVTVAPDAAATDAAAGALQYALEPGGANSITLAGSTVSVDPGATTGQSATVTLSIPRSEGNYTAAQKSCTITVSEGIPAGDYIVAVKSGDDYIPMTSIDDGASTKRFKSASSISWTSGTVNAIAAHVWALAPTAGGYTLEAKANAGNYVTIDTGKNAAQLSTTAAVLAFEEQDGGGYHVTTLDNATTRYLSKNSNGAYFAFYGNTNQNATIYLIPANVVQQVASPVIAGANDATEIPNPGSLSVTITCATGGATIHYTTDGSAPTAGSPTYSSALSLEDACTVKAIAVKDGMADSEAASQAFTKASGGGGGPKTYTITFVKGTTFETNQTGYTGTFVNTCDGLALTLGCINNGGNSNWTEMRAGRNNSNASVATITTNAAISEAIGSVSINVTQVDPALVTSAKLYVASTSTFEGAAEYSFTINGTGKKTATVTAPAANKFYKIEISLAAGSSNGHFRFNQLEYVESE